MTINGHKHRDELVWHETTPGYRDVSLTFKIKKGKPFDLAKYEEIEINLDKEDTSQLLKILFDLYREVEAEYSTPLDYVTKETMVEEIRGVLEFQPEFG